VDFQVGSLECWEWFGVWTRNVVKAKGGAGGGQVRQRLRSGPVGRCWTVGSHVRATPALHLSKHVKVMRLARTFEATS
jgi:hypothetical protein